MAEYPKVSIGSQKSSPHDLTSQIQELENIDIFNTYWAKITAQDADYYDKYLVAIYPNEKLEGAMLAFDYPAFSVDIKRYSVNEVVKVYWRPATQYALIFQRSLFSWIKVSTDWQPNNSYIVGKRCAADGTLLEASEPDVSVSLTGSNYSVAYAPFKKNDIVIYLRWPFDAATSWGPGPESYDGVVLNFPQIPLPTGLHQVLTCVGKSVHGPSRIAWGYVRTIDRINEPSANTPQEEL